MLILIFHLKIPSFIPGEREESAECHPPSSSWSSQGDWKRGGLCHHQIGGPSEPGEPNEPDEGSNTHQVK